MSKCRRRHVHADRMRCRVGQQQQQHGHGQPRQQTWRCGVRGGDASAAHLDDVDGHREEVDPPLGGDSTRLGLEPRSHRQLLLIQLDATRTHQTCAATELTSRLAGPRYCGICHSFQWIYSGRKKVLLAASAAAASRQTCSKRSHLPWPVRAMVVRHAAEFSATPCRWSMECSAAGKWAARGEAMARHQHFSFGAQNPFGAQGEKAERGAERR